MLSIFRLLLILALFITFNLSVFKLLEIIKLLLLLIVPVTIKFFGSFIDLPICKLPGLVNVPLPFTIFCAILAKDTIEETGTKEESKFSCSKLKLSNIAV